MAALLESAIRVADAGRYFEIFLGLAPVMLFIVPVLFVQGVERCDQKRDRLSMGSRRLARLGSAGAASGILAAALKTAPPCP